jgi:DNA polymerase-3 subunit delta'
MTRFTDILGQPDAVTQIQLAFRADRLPHGMIFAGPPGVGKATTAAALAGAFLCENPKNADACGKCPSCLAMSAAAHPDYHVVTKELARLHDRSGVSKATQLSIDVVRFELAAPAARKSALGRGKVFIVEQAELMTAPAQNALLKTLEEPAGRTLIVLLAAGAGVLLPTVRSRCQTILFTPLDAQTVRDQLQRRGMDRAAAADAANLCDGSLGMALQWIADGLLPPARAVSDAIDAILDGKPAPDLADLLRKSAQAQVEKMLARDELTSKDSAMRDALGVFLCIASRRLRQRLRQSDPEMLETACQAIDLVAQSEKYLEANVNVSLALEQLGIALERLVPAKVSTGFV